MELYGAEIYIIVTHSLENPGVIHATVNREPVYIQYYKTKNGKDYYIGDISGLEVRMGSDIKVIFNKSIRGISKISILATFWDHKRYALPAAYENQFVAGSSNDGVTAAIYLSLKSE